MSRVRDSVTSTLRLSLLNHFLAGIHVNLHAAVLGGCLGLVVFIVGHALHFLELPG